MSTTPPITAWVPKVSAEPTPAEIHRLFTLAFQKLGNHATAFGIQQAKIDAIKTGTSTTIVEGGGSGGSITPATPAGIPVNNQSGQTAYTTVSGDDGALIVLSDASAIAVSLISQTPPWSCFVMNQSALGAGTATLTPASGTINGAATLTLLPSYGAIVAFDGTNWWALTMPIVPVNTPAVAHEWLASYNAATGAFTLTQPAYADISGTPAPILTGTSGSLGGSAMTAGQTITTTVTVTGATTAMVATTSPATYPGASFVWDAYVSAANTVTVCLTAVLAGTPVAGAYNVRVIP